MMAVREAELAQAGGVYQWDPTLRNDLRSSDQTETSVAATTLADRVEANRSATSPKSHPGCFLILMMLPSTCTWPLQPHAQLSLRQGHTRHARSRVPCWPGLQLHGTIIKVVMQAWQADDAACVCLPQHE